MKKIRLAALLILTIAASLAFGHPAQAEEMGVEVKFLLDENLVLDENNDLTPAYQELFGTGDEYITGTLMYLETPERSFIDEGWINRLRWRGDKKKPSLTCKKRYSVEGDDLDGALAKALADGFDASDDEVYEAEVDWSFDSMTLGFTNETKFELPEGMDDLAQLDLAGALAIAHDNMPAEEANWAGENWGLEAIMNARIVGPLVYKRYTGTFEGHEVHVEVWPSPNGKGGFDHIAELSYKSDSFDEAKSLRPEMRELISNAGVLVEKSALKTNAIIDAYLGPRPDKATDASDVDQQEQERQQREAERQKREQEREQREAERQQRESERDQREQEKNARKQQRTELKAARKLQHEQDKAARKLQHEQEKAARKQKVA